MQNSYNSTFYQRWARRLIELYPAAWRERYAEEMLMILEESAPTFTTLCNLFISMLDAYIHRNLVAERTPYMLQRMRFNSLAIYAATLIFFAAWFITQLRTASGVRSLMANFSYSSPSLLVNVIHSVSSILLWLLLLGGLPILLETYWKALKTRNMRALLLGLLGCVGPFITVFVVSWFMSFEYAIGLQEPFSMWLSLFVGFIGLDISLAFIFFAVQSVAPSRRITHYMLYLATLVPLVMLVGLAALLLWAVPYFTTGLADGSMPFSYVLRHAVLILVMVVALAFAFIALQQGFQAKEAAQAQLKEEATQFPLQEETMLM